MGHAPVPPVGPGSAPSAAGGTPSGAAAAPAGRLGDLDALRGLALLGILVVNVWAFIDPSVAAGTVGGARPTGVDAAVQWLLQAAVQGKAYLLLGAIFGYALSLQTAVAERDGASLPWRTVRRCVGLFVLGVAHGTLLFFGDVLTAYAVLGLVLLAMRRVRTRILVVLAAVLAAGPALLYAALGGLLLAAGEPLAPAAVARAERAEAAAALLGAPAEVAALHARTFLELAPLGLLAQGPGMLAALIAGLLAGRARLLAAGGPPAALLRRTVALGVGLGGALSGVAAALVVLVPDGELLGAGLQLLGGPPLAAGYVALAVLALRGRAGGVLRAALRPAGRVALSTYVGQSVVLGLLFTGYGLALGDRLPDAVVLATTLVVFAAMSLLAAAWTRRFAHGPLEWPLRWLTLARRPPLRRPLGA